MMNVQNNHRVNMKEKKKIYCERCKRNVNEEDYSRAHGMCDVCYAEVWDEGFSSQADYSDKMFELQLEKEWEDNERMNKENIKDEDIKYFFDHYWIGRIVCRKCGCTRTTWDRPKKAMSEAEKQKRIEKLQLKCPKCGVKGFLLHV